MNNTVIRIERLEWEMKYQEEKFMEAFNASAEYYRRAEYSKGEGWRDHYNLWYTEMLSRERKLGELYKEYMGLKEKESWK